MFTNVIMISHSLSVSLTVRKVMVCYWNSKKGGYFLIKGNGYRLPDWRRRECLRWTIPTNRHHRLRFAARAACKSPTHTSRRWVPTTETEDACMHVPPTPSVVYHQQQVLRRGMRCRRIPSTKAWQMLGGMAIFHMKFLSIAKVDAV